MGLKLGNHPTHAMLLNELKVIKIFCEIDDFVNSCEKFVEGKGIINLI